jgi:hypothetical protein
MTARSHDSPRAGVVRYAWRAIVLFRQNVASHKFALAGALPEVGNRVEAAPLVHELDPRVDEVEACDVEPVDRHS